MNQRTVRLLNTYARLTGQTPRQLRQWWYRLSWRERTRERQRIEQELRQAAGSTGTS